MVGELGEGGAGGKGNAAKKDEVETCEIASPSNKVKVCVPEFETRPQRLHFYSQETYDEEYCYYKYVIFLFLNLILITFPPFPFPLMQDPYHL